MPPSRPVAGTLRRCAAVVAALAVALTATHAAAQRPGAGGARAAVRAPSTSFVSMAQAVEQQDYTVVQLRRFVDEQGHVVSVREQVKVDANGTSSPAFLLSFLGVEGQLPGSAAHLQWEQTYERYGALFHRHGSFAIRDLTSVQQNYSLHEFGAVVRAGRSAVRTVVFPTTNDKSIWVVDVDAATSVPLYWAEFDFQFHLLAEVEAVSFLDSVIMPAVVLSAAPSAVVHADFAAADAWLGQPAGLIQPPPAFAGYEVATIETRDDPLNGQQKLVTTYTDGVDEFLVTQLPGSADPFATLLPASGKGGASSMGHTIGRFHDVAMRVLLFWDDGVAFQVAGRGSLERLDEVARHLYRQALSTH